VETNDRAETFERFGINRIYETSQAVANKLRRMADDIENEIERAKANEEHANLTRATSYIGLPAQVVAIVTSGVANAQLDGPARQLRELLLSREAQRVIDARTAEQETTVKDAIFTAETER
jgi:hypothetical protein